MEWCRRFADTIEEKHPGVSQLLLLDECSAQRTDIIEKYLRHRGVLPVFIPGGCTDVLQPVDHHVGAVIKTIIQKLYKVELEISYEEWRNYEYNDSLTDSKRRMLMALWVDMAWELLSQQDMMEKAFKACVLIKKDGTHEFKFQRYKGEYKILPDDV